MCAWYVSTTSSVDDAFEDAVVRPTSRLVAVVCSWGRRKGRGERVGSQSNGSVGGRFDWRHRIVAYCCNDWRCVSRLFVAAAFPAAQLLLRTAGARDQCASPVRPSGVQNREKLGATNQPNLLDNGILRQAAAGAKICHAFRVDSCACGGEKSTRDRSHIHAYIYCTNKMNRDSRSKFKVEITLFSIVLQPTPADFFLSLVKGCACKLQRGCEMAGKLKGRRYGSCYLPLVL